jgi:hypothetical protein
VQVGAGRLTVEQSDWLDTLAAAGVPAVVVRPADYDETIATIMTGIRRTSRRIWLQDSRRHDDNDAE